MPDLKGLKGMKIRTKLYLLVGMTVAGMLVFGVGTYSALENVKVGGPIYQQISQDTQLQSDIMPPPLNILEARLTVYRMLYYMGRDNDGLRESFATFEELKNEYLAAYDKWMKTLPEGEIRELVLKKAHDPIVHYFEIGETRLIPAVKQGNRQEVNVIISEMKPLYDSHRRAMQDANKLLEQKLDAEARLGESTVQSRLMTLVSIASAVTILVSILGYLIAGGILRPLKRTVEVLQGLAEGDLTQHLNVESNDEVGAMGNALNKAISGLSETIESLAASAEHVASASEEISSTATQSSRAAMTQKDQTAQVATAMQEMSTTVAQVSEHATRAAKGAQHAGETARSGGAIVGETVNVIQNLATSSRNTSAKIQELGKSSNQIGQIIGVIDDIADQTNLLALNAAIEAARAGEQGRGFAVVADEVRKLAERTTHATKEIAQMIKNIQEETRRAVEAMESGTASVECGVESATKAGAALQQIIDSSEQVDQMISQIATAAIQQSSATQQINANMEQIAKLVEESAMGAEQSAKACTSLSDLALDLQRIVSRFKVTREDTVPSQQRHFRPPQLRHAGLDFSAAPEVKRTMTVQ